MFDRRRRANTTTCVMRNCRAEFTHLSSAKLLCSNQITPCVEKARDGGHAECMPGRKKRCSQPKLQDPKDPATEKYKYRRIKRSLGHGHYAQDECVDYLGAVSTASAMVMLRWDDLFAGTPTPRPYQGMPACRHHAYPLSLVAWTCFCNLSRSEFTRLQRIERNFLLWSFMIKNCRDDESRTLRLEDASDDLSCGSLVLWGR
ncbi:hypothetical protein BKA63DRAFT_251942 [Paraphoma chrysanthemicola]|nr:hypothetical protein BKA63DRAFT_251942 [Paraphoma chrysanthemicola]